jgi:beta-galactosidase
VPAEWKDKRLFLRFNGVQSIADVFINGRHIGDHYGGYTAFAFEITDKVSYGYNNSLFVAVSNTYRNDVLPTSVEENVYGGIYRDVELIVTDKTTISPLYYGTDGVMIHQTEVSNERVSGRVDVALLGRKDATHNVTVDFYAPDGYVSLSKSVKAKIDGNLVSVPFSIDNAELWSLNSPRLYTVKVTVGEESVEVKTGFRKIEVTPEKKFTINGRRVRIHGVLLGHDRMPKGNAVSKAELESDLALVREMGANAVRSVTGPHSQTLYDEMDRMGYSRMVDEDLFWGVWLNSMFDMGSVRYVRGVRNSGVVAGDHKSRKNLFYLYKSQWNRRQPTLYITDKARDIRSCEKQVFTVYSSVGRPIFTINGDTVACENIARSIYRTDTLKLKGTNEIKASVADKSDEMTLTIGNYLKVK